MHEVRLCTTEGQGLVVPAFQQGLQRRRRQPAEPQRPQDRLPLEGDCSPGGADRHPGELRPDRRGEGRKTGKKKRTQIFPATTSSTWCGKAAGRRRGNGWAALPDPALGGQRQVELHRLAGAPADRREARTDKEVFDSIIVITDRRILDEQIRDTIKQFAQVGATVGHAEHSGDLRRSSRRQEDHHHHGAEVPVHPGRDRQRPSSATPLRHHHRRGAFGPGRQDLGRDEQGLGAAAEATDEERRRRPW
jgi:type I restriction enzyme R subunit